MAWRRTGDKQLTEPVMAYFADADMRHSASMTYEGGEMAIILQKTFSNAFS